MLVVGHIVEVDQPTNDIVFEPLLVDAAAPEADHIDLLGAQMPDPQFIIWRRVVDRR